MSMLSLKGISDGMEPMEQPTKFNICFEVMMILILNDLNDLMFMLIDIDEFWDFDTTLSCFLRNRKTRFMNQFV